MSGAQLLNGLVVDSEDIKESVAAELIGMGRRVYSGVNGEEWNGQ